MFVCVSVVDDDNVVDDVVVDKQSGENLLTVMQYKNINDAETLFCLFRS